MHHVAILNNICCGMKFHLSWVLFGFFNLILDLCERKSNSFSLGGYMVEGCVERILCHNCIILT